VFEDGFQLGRAIWWLIAQSGPPSDWEPFQDSRLPSTVTGCTRAGPHSVEDTGLSEDRGSCADTRCTLPPGRPKALCESHLVYRSLKQAVKFAMPTENHTSTPCRQSGRSLGASSRAPSRRPQRRAAARADPRQPISSERRAAAFTARMSAPRTPADSSSARPTMVVPAGLVTLSFSSAGCVRRLSPAASSTCARVIG